MKRWNSCSSISSSHQTIETWKGAEPTWPEKSVLVLPRSICKTPTTQDWWQGLIPGLSYHLLSFRHLCLSAHKVDYVSANLRVSRGSISRLLKTLIVPCFPYVPKNQSKLMVIHLWSYSPKQVIHVCKEGFSREDR